MYHHFHRYGQLIVTAILLAASLAGCKRDDSSLLPSAEITPEQSASFMAASMFNGNSAAALIAASEKLSIPAEIALPENTPYGNSRVVTYFAEGVQKYRAREKAGSVPLSYEWVLVAPLADLYDNTNTKIGTHTAGPTWQLSPLDSIYAQQFSPPRTAPSPDPESIPWLLLMPKAGTTPTGIFAEVDYIQRIATKGGKAPATPPATINDTVDVKYKAVYRFSKKN